MKKKILYVEDELFLAQIVRETLQSKDYEVVHLKDGHNVLHTAREYQPDICILDVMLPHTDGFTLGSSIRELYPKLPIIFLTAKTQTEDVIKGFSSGGTDYLKKPFSIEELIIRIENQLRITNAIPSDEQTIGNDVLLGTAIFHPKLYELHIDNTIQKLSNREAQVLCMLCAHKNEPIERRILLNKIWGDDSFFNSRNLDVYIRKLRGYFNNIDEVEIITLKGIGYHFVVKEHS